MDSKQYDNVQDKNIEEVMKQSYIEYAMSVIVSRALPDVRDGLKPVHRRILYAMNELNLDYNKPYKKSARIVGDTMGKYHPHGDSSIYDAMVRMAQDFSMRYMLVDGHGNFGSVDGDGAAASRYTEARLSRISAHMLADIEKDTVNFEPNYTEEFIEPTVLPAKIPNLLINGSSGIAVGMATNIPPHNITEVITAIIKIIDNKILEDRETDLDEMMDIIKGPDFPTAANILGVSGIRKAYRTGRGKVIMRATTYVEIRGGRNVIVVNELPYQVNKARLIEKITDLVKDKRIDGISNLRDESDRKGLKIAIELKKDANPEVVLNGLYKYSQMQETFGINMLALVNNEPKVLNLKEILDYYLEHQKDVITRRTKFELAKAKKREHILQGYLIALDNIEEVIKIIRASSDTRSAKDNLIERFGFTEEQVTAIVEMPLRSLTSLEIDKINAEMEKLKLLIAELEKILNDEKELYLVIKKEISEVLRRFSDVRRTQFLDAPEEIDLEDLIDDEPNVITLTDMDYIKRLQLSTYRSQNRGGKGIMGMQTRDEDIVSNLFIANTHNTILFFTNEGRVYAIKAYQIPEVGRTARGTAIINLLNLNPGEKIAAHFPLTADLETADKYLMMFTKKGIVKKTALTEFSSIRTSGKIALSIKEDDELLRVVMTDGNKSAFIATQMGMGIHFDESQVRPVGRSASGVRGIKLRENDFVVNAGVFDDDNKVLFVSENGYGKCTESQEFRKQNRSGVGLKVYKVTEKTGKLVSINFVNDNEEIMIMSSEGIVIRLRVSNISTIGRSTQGVKLIDVGKDDARVISTAKITETHLEEEEVIYVNEDADDNNE